MDYRELAIDELKKLNQNYMAEKIIKLRIEELDSTLKSSGGGSGGASHSPGTENKTEHKWLNIISRLEDEKKRLREVTQSTKLAEMALSAVTEEEAKILREVYVKGRTMEEVATAEHISRATAFRLRDKAVINFTRALFGSVIT